MDQFQEAHESSVGQNFITWYNAKHRTAFKFVGRPDEAPDLIFRDGDRELRAEVTTCYYDPQHAQFLWKPARGKADAPRSWSAQDFVNGLIHSINDELERKCNNDTGQSASL